MHRKERQQDGYWQGDDRDQRRAHVPKKDDANECDDDAFFDQLFAKRSDGAFDEVTAVVSGDDANAFGKRGFNLLEFAFDAIDYGESIFSVAHHHDAADDFAFSIQLRDAPPDVRTKVHGSNVSDVNRNATLDFEGNALDVLD